MAGQRVILHSDLNSFYASVEMMLAPKLRGKAVAVCGSCEERHGIVLAKSELAKKAGVKTGMVNWEAKRRCPNLIIVPPQFEQYLKYSRLTREIYQRYTDLIEPFGIDECWLDVTGSQGLLGTGEQMAQHIRESVRSELGLTVSIGVSFNKIFAKLGSDLRKPDAVTVIDRDNYRQVVWNLPANQLLYVGRSTERKLAEQGIRTIGDIVNAGAEVMQRLLGKNGGLLWVYACGLDESRVVTDDLRPPVKSVSHGITCRDDLVNNEEVWMVLLELSQDIGHKLRLYELYACGVQLAVKDKLLSYRQYQAPLDVPSQSPMEIAVKAQNLFAKNYGWQNRVRALTVRVINLLPSNWPQQMNVFDDQIKRQQRQRLEQTVDELRSRFGNRAIYNAVLLRELKMAEHVICNFSYDITSLH